MHRRRVCYHLKESFRCVKCFLQNFGWKICFTPFSSPLSHIQGWLAPSYVRDHSPKGFRDSFMWLTFGGMIGWDTMVAPYLLRRRHRFKRYKPFVFLLFFANNLDFHISLMGSKILNVFRCPWDYGAWFRSQQWYQSHSWKSKIGSL